MTDTGSDELCAAIDVDGPVADAFRAVPREHFIPPRMWVQEDENGPYEAVNAVQERDRWHANVYSNRVIVTQFDDGNTCWPGVGDRPTCSSSMPSVVAAMIEAMELEGHWEECVLEIGTGTGWNAALLATLTGRVHTLEVDKTLAEDARRVLLQHDYVRNLTVWHGDAATQRFDYHVESFDRIVSTASVQFGQFPYGWVEQTTPGGLIITPMRTDMASGPLVRFEVLRNGSAIGRALSTRVGFMELRTQRTPVATWGGLLWDDPAADRTYTTVQPWSMLLNEASRWAIGVAMRSCRFDVWKKTPQRPHGVAWLVDPLTGSWASAAPAHHNEQDNTDDAEPGAYVVRQHGPRRLWDEAEAAYTWWQAMGEPDLDAWEWTVTANHQSIALRPYR